MLESAERVVVLGRSGDAQQQLARALQEIGVEPLAVGDFDQLDPAQIRTQQPTVFLVSMDERMDASSIDRWQDLFDDAGIRAVFDDADVSSRLSGWDLARWARHLVAKVLGRDDVLPPVHANAERLGVPGTRVDDAHAAADESDSASDLQHDDYAGDVADAQAHEPADSQPEFAIDTSLAADESLADSMTDQNAPAAEFTFESDGFSDVASGDELGSFSVSPDETEVATDDAAFAELSAQFEAEQQRDRSNETEVAPALDDLLRADAESDIRLGEAAVDSNESPKVANDRPAAISSGLDLELSPIDDVPAVSPEKPAAAPEVDINAPNFSLEPITAESAGAAAETDTSGALAIVAGLGGPDAVRQVLSGLPSALSVPVLLWQHLDAGKHDRLAQQLGKASKMPVYLARPGELAKPGAVAVMTPAVGVEHDVDGWWFTQCEGGIRSALESALTVKNSIAIVLSGADGSVVSVASAHQDRGGEVRVQSPDSCFDAASAAALLARGIAAAAPSEIAAFATAHWAPAATE